ncbi:MAG: HEAT repeat domain-containing protein [Planctomycetota bacterium]
MIILVPVVLAVVLLPCLFLYSTCYARKLSDDEIERRLLAAESAELPTSAGRKERGEVLRHAQHALEQVSKRLEAGQDISRFRPAILALTRHEEAVMRRTVVWLMGWDRQNPEFQQAFKRMLGDPDPQVRYNAALRLSAVREGGMTLARPVLHAALRPLEVRVTSSGRIREALSVGDKVLEGAALARLETSEGGIVSVAAPLSGRLSGRRAGPGAWLARGDVLCSLLPNSAQVREVMKALYYFGDLADLDAIRPLARGSEPYGSELQEEARRVVEAIKTRK